MSEPISELQGQINLVMEKLDRIDKYIDKAESKYDAHISSAQSFRDKVISHEIQISSLKAEFNRHCAADTWLFGIIITVGLAILGKLMNIF